MNLAAVMNEVAARLATIPSLGVKRTFAYPPAKITPRAAVVTYPIEGTFDVTYGRGVDKMTGVVVILVGRPTDRATRDHIAGYIDGAGEESVKEKLDAPGYTSCDGVRVASWETDVHTIGGTDYLAAIFQLDIEGPGTA